MLDVLAQLLGSASSTPQQTAVQSTPMDLKAMFAPILESVAAEAKRKADPVSRLYDVGGAIYDSAATGSPYAKNLAALDQARTSAISGAGNMFLNVLGMERQLEQLKAESGYRTETLRQGAERLATDRDQFKVRSGQRDREITNDENRTAALEAERKARRVEDEQKRQEADHDVMKSKLGSGTVNPIEFSKFVETDPEYQKARKDRNWVKANEIALKVADTIGPKTDLPAEIRKQHTSYLNAMDAVSELKKTIMTGPSVIHPSDRAKIAQDWDRIVLHYGNALGRGATYTKEEMARVVGAAGQSPTDLRYRSIEDIKTWKERFERFESSLSREVDNLVRSRARPEGTAAPKVEPRGSTYEIQAPPGWKATGRFTPDGRPIFTDGKNEAWPPKR